MGRVISDEEMSAIEAPQQKRIISDEEMNALEATPKNIPILESIARGGGQGLTAGFQEEASAGLTKGMIKLNNLMKEHPTLARVLKYNPITGVAANLIEQDTTIQEPSYEEIRDQMRADNQAAQEANPWAYGAGEVGGGLASTLVPGAGFLNAAKGAKLATVIGKGALQGGIAGAGYSNADDVGELATDIGTGSLFGGALSPLSKLVPSKEKLTRSAAEDALSAYGFERGTIKKLLKESKGDYEKLISLGDDLLNKEGSLTPFMGTEQKKKFVSDLAESGWDTMKNTLDSYESAGGVAKNAFGETVKKGTVSRYQLENEIKDSLSSFDNETKEKVLNFLNQKMPVKQGEKLTLNQAQNLKNIVNEQINWGSVDPSAQDKAYRKIYGKISEGIDSNIDQLEPDIFSASKPSASTFKQGKADYALSQKLNDPMLNKIAREAGNKKLSLTDWILLSAGVDSSGDYKVPAIYAGKKYFEKFGPQQSALLKKTTAPFLGGVKSLFSKAASGISRTDLVLPDSQEFRQTAQDLSETDNNAASNYMLSERLPNYRSLKEE